MFMDPNMNYVIKAYRLALGMTQATLGGAIGKSNVFVSMYERGLIDGNGAEVYMQKVLIEAAMDAQGGKEFVDAHAAMILCNIYRQKEGHTPLKAWKTAKAMCKRFGNVKG